MDSKTLLAAINANDPDGNALSRVIDAATITIQDGAGNPNGMYQADDTNCLLAHAWNAYQVGNFQYYKVGDEGTYLHDYKEVVHWYDNLPNNVEAAEKVLELLPSDPRESYSEYAGEQEGFSIEELEKCGC